MEVEPRTPGPTPSGGLGGRDDDSPIESSTPGSGAELTQRDLQRVNRRFVSVSEHLREPIAETRAALNQTRITRSIVGTSGSFPFPLGPGLKT